MGIADQRESKADTEHSVVDALYRISSLVSNIDDPREALEIIIDEIVATLPTDSAAIELINPDTRLLEIEVFRGFPEHSKEMQLRLGQGVTGWVALHGRPMLVPDVTEDPYYIPVNPSIRCELAVPMIGADGATIGVVNIDSNEKHAFGDRELKILTLLTNEATKVVSRLWLIKKLRDQTDHLRALVNTGRSIVKKRELSELLNSITDETVSLMKCRVCALYLFDPKSRTLALEAISGVPRHEESLGLEESAIGTAIRRRKLIEVYDLARVEEHHFVPLVHKLGLVSLLSCPIIYEDEVIGVVNAYTNKPHRFNNAEKRVFETLAGMSGVAIQNARLYARIFKSEETLRRTEKLTTLGLLSAEIAHEIRNPLTVIRLLFDAMDLEFDEDDVRHRDHIVIQEKLDQLEGIVSRVLSFGKSREDLRARYDIRSIVRDTLHLVRLKLQQNRINLIFDEGREALMVDASRGQLQQAVLNIIINATQALGNRGGEIRVRIYTSIHEDIQVANIDVSDTGPGVPDEIRSRIFDSFLTGNPEGTGLGLAIVKRILRSHSGDVDLVDSHPGGTTMRIWLPVV